MLESNAESSWILESMPIGVWVGHAPSGEVAYTNRAFCAILGMPALAGVAIEEVPRTYGIFDRAGRLYPHEKLPFSRVLATGRPVTVDDLVVHRPDCRKVHLRAVGYPVARDEQPISHVIVAFIDITREVTVERELRETADRLALAINHSPVALWTADPAGVITLSEGAGLVSLGVKPGQLVGVNVFELYKDHPTIPDDIRRSLMGESHRYTTEVQTPEGIVIYYDTWLAPLRNNAAEVIGVVGISHDVSEVRKLQAQTIQNDRVIALGTLAASVAHEINNPLTYMLGNAAALCAEVRDLAARGRAHAPLSTDEVGAVAEKLDALLHPLREGIERIASITGELRTFNRAGEDKVALVDVGSVVSSVLQLLQKDLEARARLTVDIGPGTYVLGTSARLAQVVMNLLVNAMQAVPDTQATHNRIGVVVRQEGIEAVIEVSDNGPGIPVAERERIFEPFVTTKQPGEGSGLGLFVSRNIARGMGGDLRVVESPGGGGLFRVVIPSAQRSCGDVAAVVPSETARVSRVLLIDDDSLVAKVLAAQLAAAGHIVEIELDAQRALSRLLDQGDAFDLVYCDLMMRGMTGMEIGDAVRARRPAMFARLVFMTGGAFAPRAQQFVVEHAAQCVYKPFDIVADCVARLARLR